MRLKLVYGDEGRDVTELQQALLAAGFSPGDIDGDFGTGTFNAVSAFQQGQGLLADGIAGPRTLKALGLAESADLPDATGDMSVQVASLMLPGAPLANIKTHLPIILASLRAFEIPDRTMVLMAIATIRAETAGCAPISEGISAFNTSPNGHPFDLYDHRSDLGNQGPPDGALFKGRGFVQLTGRANYLRYGPRLPSPVDLVKNPELAKTPTVAADLLSLFLADRELQIKDAILHANFQAARRLVNGGLHGWEQFEASFKKGDMVMPR
jgi:peptidoglycan L-alanyl-D-glutamate endopeptidase CwlK